jgi:putative ABC transport system permease protein
MRVIDKKLLRDVQRLWPQALAIALVVAAGVATMILAIGAYRSLYETRAAYYERYRFADVFATVTRAPFALKERILRIPGVAAAETRIEKLVLLDVAQMPEPATAVALSVPDYHKPTVNLLYLRAGRLPEAEAVDEVTVNETFAKAHGLYVGDTVRAILNGRKRTLRIVGIALSPEYIYALGPGDLMPDDRRFADLWMSEKALAAIFDLDGAFNSVVIKLIHGANQADVIDALDDILARYGGTGAIGRKDQQSHAFLDAELEQLKAFGRILPPIFLFVSAFLINLILSRQIALEREQIGLFKALGYRSGTIVMHYVKFVLIIVGCGVGLGVFAGTWLGRGLTRLYGDFYHFPFLIFSRDPDMYVIAALVSTAAGLIGAVSSVRSVLSLAPAVAMQPPAPPRYRRTFAEMILAGRYWSQMTLMSLRHLLRWPMRAALTALGVGLATSLLITALFSIDAVDFMIDVAYFQTERQDATLNLTERKGIGVLDAVAHLPGVQRAEPYRVVPAKLRNGHLERKVAIYGKPRDMELSRVLDGDFRPVSLPKTGLMINGRVAELLGVGRGDTIEVEILEGRRQKTEAVVSDLIESYFGLGAYMDLAALNRLMGEGPEVSGAHISYDSAQEGALFDAIKRTPAIGSITLQKVSLQQFRNTLAENITIMTTVYVGLAVIVAFGVVYNSARIQLSENARELASLRVLGFTRAEVSNVLFLELGLIVLVAIPLGWLLGYAMAWSTVQAFATDIYRIPFVIERATYAKAALVILGASAVSALIVRRRIDRLDLIAVLKSRE